MAPARRWSNDGRGDVTGVAKRNFTPLILLMLFVAGLSWRYSRPSATNVQSQQVNFDLPSMTLPSGRAGQPPLILSNLSSGKPQLINLFASWCLPCIAEARQLAVLKAEGIVITGIAVRDRPEAVTAFVAAHGDPFGTIGLDSDSRAQRSLGANGVPETLVVDGKGVVRHRFIGGLDAQSLDDVRGALAGAAA